MQVHVELTKRLAEMAGFRDTTLEVDPGKTLDEALSTLVDRFASVGAHELIEDGKLHPSILVVVDGAARPTGHNDLKLTGNESIDLLLPIAGG